VSTILIAFAMLALPGFFERADVSVEGVKITPAPARPLKLLELKLTLAARVPRPTAMATRHGDDAIYIASKKGWVWRLSGGQRTKVLDIADEISIGFEQGLLGIAFTPDGRLLVINFTNKDDSSVTRVYSFGSQGAVESSGKDLIVVKKPAAEHNSGQLAFGPDGYLYLTIGDGGLRGDPDNNAQSLDKMLGKMHRIEILPNLTYRVPPDNPFVGKKGARGEIWNYGFRNAWRFSFDRKTGDLWITDVGRDHKEEIDFEPAPSKGGHNYGWHFMEGSIPYEGGKPPKDWVPPIYDYDHDGTTCAITGGFVYRGLKVKGLEGAYLFSDYCKGGIEALRVKKDAKGEYEVSEHRLFDAIKVGQISSFGEDAAGELYALALDEGVVYRVEGVAV
jgi:glucose/arabinose dehydrogenase